MKAKRTFEEEKADTRVEISFGSVYESLGFKNHAEMATKADLVMEISKAIKKESLPKSKVPSYLTSLSQNYLSF